MHKLVQWEGTGSQVATVRTLKRQIHTACDWIFTLKPWKNEDVAWHAFRSWGMRRSALSAAECDISEAADVRSESPAPLQEGLV